MARRNIILDDMPNYEPPPRMTMNNIRANKPLWYWEKFRVSHIDPSTARVRPLIQYWDEKKARKREKIMYGVIRVLAPGNRHETVISGLHVVSSC
ncbi:Os04g0392900 [Oryza sativa Japonica Group]|uniref:Os04g0392900 protein n=1 Tax=Oryza sativa subsp. japonica TaxID=39947 RepID=Q0JDM6_ORYSJ|nr:Os04g0392900 [Oryza sativa Japonica Group]|eukprot:NP_001052647.2 Os04g0392900 [Oryza sativa Japonica Group]